MSLVALSRAVTPPQQQLLGPSDGIELGSLPFAHLLTLASSQRAVGFAETSLMGLSHSTSAPALHSNVKTLTEPPTDERLRVASERTSAPGTHSFAAKGCPVVNPAPDSSHPHERARRSIASNESALCFGVDVCANRTAAQAPTTKPSLRPSACNQALNWARSAMPASAVALSVQATAQGLRVLARLPATICLDPIQLDADVRALLAEHGLGGTLLINGRRARGEEGET